VGQSGTMTEMASRFLYLTRHGEATPDETGLTERGERQAVLLGERLRDVPLAIVHHGPLPRAARTAHLIADQLGDVPTSVDQAAGDYVPYVPSFSELPADSAEVLTEFLGDVSAMERTRGAMLAAEAERRYTGAVAGPEDRHELVVTHNFLVGWLVRAALDAPNWRWLGLNHGNAALTVIRYAPGRPTELLVYNDVRHLPAELRWTGLPPALHV
jgi:broad specificity phosphatase PhoE